MKRVLLTGMSGGAEVLFVVGCEENQAKFHA